VLSEAAQEAVLQFTLGQITEEQLVLELGVDPRAEEGYVLELLVEAVRQRDPDGAEAALILASWFDVRGPRYLEVLCDLLVADWHTRHEDVARALQLLGDNNAVPALRYTAELDLPCRDYDDYRALSRKCMWALSDIRTADAVAALESLVQSRNPRVRELAQYHLAKVRNGEPPSPGRLQYQGH
jgi:HEAT repeat protein